MKIKSRKTLLEEYNTNYPDRIYDPDNTLLLFFQNKGWDYEKAAKKALKKLNTINMDRKYNTIRFVMYEYPMKTDRPRTFRGHTFSPNAAANKTYFEKAVRKVIKQVKLITTPAQITIKAYMEMPAQVKPDEVILFELGVLNPVTTPDYDNIGKCYTDILKDTIISDDDIFYKGTIEKYYSVLPRVEIIITCLEKHESDFIFKKLKSRKSIKELMDAGYVELHQLDYGK